MNLLIMFLAIKYARTDLPIINDNLQWQKNPFVGIEAYIGFINAFNSHQMWLICCVCALE